MAAPTRSASHRRELQHSRNEILIGEVIAMLADEGYAVVGMESDADYQRVRFHVPKDEVLSAVCVALDRHASERAARGKAQATLLVQAEMRTYRHHVEELLVYHSTQRLSSGNGVQLQKRNHVVVASMSKQVGFEGSLDKVSRAQLQSDLLDVVKTLRAALPVPA